VPDGARRGVFGGVPRLACHMLRVTSQATPCGYKGAGEGGYAPPSIPYHSELVARCARRRAPVDAVRRMDVALRLVRTNPVAASRWAGPAPFSSTCSPICCVATDLAEVAVQNGGRGVGAISPSRRRVIRFGSPWAVAVISETDSGPPRGPRCAALCEDTRRDPLGGAARRLNGRRRGCRADGEAGPLHC